MAKQKGSKVNNARSAILGRLRSAELGAVLPPKHPDVPRIITPASPPLEECLRRFQTELAALGVEIHSEATAGDVRDRVRTLVGGRRLLIWDPELLPYQLASVLTDFIVGSDAREKQAAAEVGLTGCDAAIAETGSLALFSGKGKSRAVSLLPSVHLAVVQRGDVCFSMGEFFERSAGRLAEAACCTFITGPSRTGDIELSLTLGVHGPAKVIVVIGP